MQRVRRIGTTLRNNWKKSVFFGLAGVYGVDVYRKKLEDDAYMRGLAREAVSYGAQVMHVDAPIYAVTVILNPVASGVKGRTRYEKYCAPLLNLAGLKVSVIRTESDGQAKDIMEIMKDADAVLVAGGDGTLMEVVTGLMRREDMEAATKVPIGILPVGKTNSMAHKLFPGQQNDVKLMGEATMAVIRQLKKPVGVIELENRSVGKKIYALNSLELGAWKDTRLLLEKWFFAFKWVKNYIPQLLYARSYLTKHKEMLWDCDLELQYPTYAARAPKEGRPPSIESQGPGRGLLSWITGGRGGDVKEDKPAGDSMDPQWCCLESGQFHGTGLRISVEEEQLRAAMYPAGVSMEEFIRHGSSVLRGRGGELEPQVVAAPALLLTPNMEEVEGDTREKKICVDGDDIELSGPLLLTYIKDRITLFCDDSIAVKEKPQETRAEPQSRWSSMTSMGLTRNRTSLQ